MYHALNYEVMTEEKRPQDLTMDGECWTFETMEFGGEYPDLMPQAIRATDSMGRSALYFPAQLNGKVIDCKHYVSSSTEGEYVVFDGGNK